MASAVAVIACAAMFKSTDGAHLRNGVAPVKKIRSKILPLRFRAQESVWMVLRQQLGSYSKNW